MTPETSHFTESLWQYYAANGRHDLLWRQPRADGSFDPYRILVSEIMLQQTQVSRVIPKFAVFLEQFPTVGVLAAAPLGDVLKAWSGLGYNRRAKFLWHAAQTIAHDLQGEFPTTLAGLIALPGVGKNTAGAILAYAYNQPAIFIETNVRTVYIHHFFADQSGIADAAIQQLLSETIDQEQPREFYWALMDYGSYLKQTIGNLNKHSTTYSKQSKFDGSRRQIRGQVLKLLGAEPRSLAALQTHIPDDRLLGVLNDLAAEGLITESAARYHV